MFVALFYVRHAEAATDVPTQSIAANTAWVVEGSPYRVLGDVTVTGGKRLTIEPGVTVDIVGDYTITADVAKVEIEGSTVTGGRLAVSDSSSSTIHFFGDVTLNDVAWDDPGAGQFRVYGSDVRARLLGDGIPAGQTLVVDGSWNHPAVLELPLGTFWNRGTIDMRDDAVLYLSGDTTIESDGEVLLGDQTIEGVAGATLTVGASQAVLVGGEIAVDVVNQGLIEAQSKKEILFSDVTVSNDTGVIRAAGGSIEFATGTVSGGVLEVSDHSYSFVYFSGIVTQTGVTWSDLGRGEFRVYGEMTARLLGDPIPADQTLVLRGGPYGELLRFELPSGTFVNNGLLELDSAVQIHVLAGATFENNGTLEITSNTSLHIESNTMLSGSGEVVLDGGVLERTEGAVLTIGPEQQVRGRGTIRIDLENQGVLEGTGGRELEMEALTISNNNGRIGGSGGTIELHDCTVEGGTLAVSDSSSSYVHFFGDVTLNDVVWEDTGAGRFRIYGPDVSARLLGDGIPEDRTLVIDGGWNHPAQLVLPGGTFWSRGTIDLQDSSALYLEGDTKLDGDGDVLLGNQTIDGAEGTTLTVGESQEVLVGGEILVDVVNLGLIEASDGEHLYLTGNSTRNSGGVIRAAGGKLRLLDCAIIGGVLEATDNRNSEVIFTGAITLEDVTWSNPGEGEFWVFLEAQLLGDGVPAEQTLALHSAIGGDARLVLSDQTLVSDGVIELQYGSDIYVASDTTLAGEGSLRMEGQPILSADGVVLTLDSRHTLEGWGDVRVPVRNLGRIEALDTNSQHTIKFEQSLQVEGELATLEGGSIEVAGPLRFDGLGRFAGRPSGTIRLGSDLLGTTQNADGYLPLETVVFDEELAPSVTQSLEAMSADLGNDPAGYDRNFAYESLVLSGTVSVQLIDASDNAPGEGAEAVYVRSISVAEGATLDLGGLNLYARMIEAGGTVVGGEIVETPDGGPVALGVATPGRIAEVGEADEWETFGWAGRSLAIFVDPGSSSSPVSEPYLEYVEVEFVDPSGAVLASDSSTSRGKVVELTGVTLPSDGVYLVRVRAGAGHTDRTGNYLITVLDVTSREHTLVLNQEHTGRLATPYHVDTWRFTANVGQQVRLDFLGASREGLSFDLIGPGGWSGFSDLTGDSELVALSSAGEYVLTVSADSDVYDVAYAFRLEETTQIPLAIGSPYSGSFIGTGQALLFRVEIAESMPMRLTLTGASHEMRVELYARLGTAPTRGVYDYRADDSAASPQEIVIPMAVTGTWYLLLYCERTLLGGDFQLLAETSSILLTSVTPYTHGNGADAVLTLTGAGFESGAVVELVGGGTTVYEAETTEVDSGSQITVIFAAETVPAGNYTVNVVLSDDVSAELADGFEMTGGGEARLETNLVLPSTLGYHVPGTLYIEYANTGGVAMPAPLLSLVGYLNGNEGALLTLDESRLVRGFWTSSIPEGFDTSVDFLASGEVPGVLQPGETGRMPVYYAGWLKPWDFDYPDFEFHLTSITQDESTPIDWNLFDGGPGEEFIGSQAWSAIRTNFATLIGETWGDYVATLSGAAARLGRLGLRVEDIAELQAFLLQEADKPVGSPLLDISFDLAVQTLGPRLIFARSFPASISGRWRLGTLGRGWSHSWDISLRKDEDGTVTITPPEGAARVFQPDSRGREYFAMTGDFGRLTEGAGGTFVLHEANSLSYAFNDDGSLDYVEGKSGNRVTASYTDGDLTGLLHSSGKELTIAYNSAGRIHSITDDQQRVVRYTYDSSGERLSTVEFPTGEMVVYEYIADQSAALEHALSRIDYSGEYSRYFTYNESGHLSATHLTDNAEAISYTYGPPGCVKVTDALGGTDTYEYDTHGLLIRITNALGEKRLYRYDKQHLPSTITDAAGFVLAYEYDERGYLVETVTPLGRATHYDVSDGQDGGATVSRANPNGNVTRCSYDAHGNLRSITYGDGTSEKWEYDSYGLVAAWTNCRGQTVQCTHDSDGRLESKTFPDGTGSVYSYDSLGRILTAARLGQAEETITFNHDDENRTETIVGDDDRWIAITYNKMGQRIKSEDQTGHALIYTYDSVGRLQEITDGAGNLIMRDEIDLVGRPAKKYLGNGARTEYEYDSAGFLKTLTNFGVNDEILSTFDIDIDNLGKKASISFSNTLMEVTYDADGRPVMYVLEGDIFSTEKIEVKYDDAASFDRVIRDGVTTVYETDAKGNITQRGDATYTYDSDGNRVEANSPRGTTNYTYNAEGKLTSVDGPGGTKTQAFDPLGYKVEATINGVETRYFTDYFIGHIVSQANAENETESWIDYGPDLLQQTDEDGNTLSPMFDPWGNTVAVLSPSGDTAYQFDYEPLGGVVGSTASQSDSPFPFTANGEEGARDQSEVGGDQYESENGEMHDSERFDWASENNENLREDLRMRAEETALAEALLYFEQRGFIDVGDRELKSLLNEVVGDADASDPMFPIQHEEALHYLDDQGGFPRMLDYWYELEDAGMITIDREMHSRLGNVVRDSWGNLRIEQNRAQITNVQSRDPNEKTGPGGYGAAGYIQPGVVMPYRIDFENDPEATAPAQQVEITDQLDVNLNWETFELTEVGFGDQIVSVPTYTRNFETSVAMSSGGIDFEVRIEVSVSSDTGQVYAVFRSIDPETSLPPPVDVGFLAPEDGTGAGQGHISYVIQQSNGLATGTEIRNIALITFDQFETIATNQIDPHDPSVGTDPTKEAPNTIDATPPTSEVAGLPDAVGTTFTLQWSGNDEGSGVRTYVVYVSDNGGDFQPYLVDTTETSTEFTGTVGHTYAFYSLATDNVGLVEADKTVAETTVRVVRKPDNLDLFQFIPSWMTQVGDDAYMPEVDLDGDGDVDDADVMEFIDLWQER